MAVPQMPASWPALAMILTCGSLFSIDIIVLSLINFRVYNYMTIFAFKNLIENEYKFSNFLAVGALWWTMNFRGQCPAQVLMGNIICVTVDCWTNISSSSSTTAMEYNFYGVQTSLKESQKIKVRSKAKKS